MGSFNCNTRLVCKTNLTKQFSELALELKKIVGKRQIIYMPNPGNLGDGLIHKGTINFFRDYGFDYDIVYPQRRKLFYYLYLLKKYRKPILIYGGGGGWCRLWHYPFDLLKIKSFRALFNKIVILPSSYEKVVPDSRIIYFSRDKFESLFVSRGKYYPDMALYLINEIEVLENESDQNLVENGWFLRTDKESLKKLKFPENNLDLSLKGDYLSNINIMFTELNKFKIIHTDRLHISIAGAILGKTVKLYPGSYFKNRAIYDSILYIFENVHFVN